jgi:hypothetical protein
VIHRFRGAREQPNARAIAKQLIVRTRNLPAALIATFEIRKKSAEKAALRASWGELGQRRVVLPHGDFNRVFTLNRLTKPGGKDGDAFIAAWNAYEYQDGSLGGIRVEFASGLGNAASDFAGLCPACQGLPIGQDVIGTHEDSDAREHRRPHTVCTPKSCQHTRSEEYGYSQRADIAKTVCETVREAIRNKCNQDHQNAKKSKPPVRQQCPITQPKQHDINKAEYHSFRP